MDTYDVLCAGHVSKDLIVTPEGRETSVGGAVVYSAVAAKAIGGHVIALTKLHADDLALLDVFHANDVPVVHRASRHTTSIENVYHTEDRERRTCQALAVADPFAIEDFPDDLEAGIYYLGGLIKGDFPEDLVRRLAGRGKVAIDAQGFLRVNDGGAMVFRDWDRKREIIPLVHFFKADAAEAEILTGLDTLEDAARQLGDSGADEVVVTHNGGVLVRAHGRTHAFPFTSRNLSGRTGRGDTCFCTYCARRKDHPPEQAALFAAALTSLKMERPGPFAGAIADVEAVIAERY